MPRIVIRVIEGLYGQRFLPHVFHLMFVQVTRASMLRARALTYYSIWTALGHCCTQIVKDQKARSRESRHGLSCLLVVMQFLIISPALQGVLASALRP